MGMWAPRFCKALYGGPVLLTMCLVMCRGTDDMPVLTSDFIHRVNSVIDDRTVLPFCFTVNLTDLTCFWESSTSDVSRYTFYYRPTVSCNLTVLEASGESWWHLCQFPAEDVELFSFYPYSISVIDRQSNTTLYRRELAPQSFVYTDPPTHFKVAEQKRPLGLLIFLMIPEKSTGLRDCFKYQINYTSLEDQKSMIFLKEKVNSEKGSVKIFLDGVTSNADYTISVRMKADSPHDGYWSAWTVTTFHTSNGLDDVHFALFGVFGFLTLLAIILMCIYQRRYLKSKVWPDIPTPEHHFKELYTTYKGNFKTWLGQTDSYLTWISRNIFHEGPITTLEVLSELPIAPRSFSAPGLFPPKDSYVVLNENILPYFPAWVEFPRHANSQRGQSNPAEVQDEQKTTTRDEATQEAEGGRHESEEARQLISGEELAMDGVKPSTLKDLPNARTILREDSLNSEEGKQSPGSSFDYTVLETCDGLLSPRTRSVPPRQPLKYASLLMSDSLEESPPPSPIIYQNSPSGQFQTAIYSQC